MEMGTLKKIVVAWALTVSAIAGADDLARFAGTFEFEANKPHKDGMKGSLKLLYKETKKDEVISYELTSVFLKSEKPVFGKTEFPSTEQTELSTVDDKGTHLAVVFKLKGPPHKWYYVYVLTSADEGKNFEGVFYRADNTVEDILKSLNAGELPETWKTEGKGSLAAQE
jgi:hypothetical protein